MRKLRVLCWLLSAYLLCFSAFAVPSANAFYEYAPVNGLEITPFALSSSVETRLSIQASSTIQDSTGQSLTSSFLLSKTSGASDIVGDSDTVFGTFNSNRATLKGLSFKGTVTFTYDLGEPQVVTLSGLPSVQLLLCSYSNDAYQWLYYYGPEAGHYNWTIKTDSSVEESVSTTDGWNSGVQVSEITITCDFGLTVTGLNQQFYTMLADQAVMYAEVNYDSGTMLVGAGGDPNTGILSGIASVLTGLIELVQGIYEAVTNIPDLIQNIISAITSLPGLIVDGIKNLFIPSQQDLETLKANYETMLEQKLGFVWQVGDWLTSFANTMISAFTGGTSYTFEFPGISFSMNGETHEIVPAQTVSLENAFMSVMRPVLGTAVSFICIIAFIRLGEHMLTAVVSGASYFEFLKGDGG